MNLLLLYFIILSLCTSTFCEISKKLLNEGIFEEDNYFHGKKGPVITEDCSDNGDPEAPNVCQKFHSEEKLLKDFPDIRLGLDSVFLRLFNSNKNDVNYFKDVHIKDPGSLSIFSKEFGYNPNHVSVFFVHGFIDSANRHLSTALASAFLSRGDVNVFNTDWSQLNLPPYSLAIQHLKTVAHAVAEFLNLAVDKNLIKTSDIHLIGHSLGAHLVGYIGRNLNSRPPVIVGLDPAGPEFITNLAADKLIHTDADCVHYLQTNRFMFGTTHDLGHANFKFNNRAILQPGCFTPGCSHFRAVEYYAEAVKNPGTLIAINCDSYEEFIENKCNGKKSVIGFPIDTSAKGLYFITTNGKEPFGRGENGIKPDNVEQVIDNEE